MKTFKDQINDNRIIMVIAPLPNSICSLIVTNLSRIRRHKINIPITKQAIYAYMTSAYTMNDDDAKDLLETLAYMGLN